MSITRLGLQSKISIEKNPEIPLLEGRKKPSQFQKETLDSLKNCLLKDLSRPLCQKKENGTFYSIYHNVLIVGPYAVKTDTIHDTWLNTAVRDAYAIANWTFGKRILLSHKNKDNRSKPINFYAKILGLPKETVFVIVSEEKLTKRELHRRDDRTTFLWQSDSTAEKLISEITLRSYADDNLSEHETIALIDYTKKHPLLERYARDITQQYHDSKEALRLMNIEQKLREETRDFLAKPKPKNAQHLLNA